MPGRPGQSEAHIMMSYHLLVVAAVVNFRASITLLNASKEGILSYACFGAQ